MKTFILSIAVLITAISCTQKEQHPTRFKFFHADTNAEFKSADAMINAMQQSKVYRLDLKTGECFNYTTCEQ